MITYRWEIRRREPGSRHQRRLRSREGDVVTSRPHVSVDPGINFGSPSVAGISTEVIAGMVWADEDPAVVAADYGITRHEVLLACWWEGWQGIYRAEWAGWVRQVAAKLGGWEPFDPAMESGPPSRDEL